MHTPAIAFQNRRLTTERSQVYSIAEITKQPTSARSHVYSTAPAG